jgi:hypothetical protein
MDAKQLRIGNFVWEDYGGVYEVANLFREGYIDLSKQGINATGRYDSESIKPIPITEDWLRNFGYELFGETYVIPDSGIFIFFDKDLICSISGDFILPNIKYVHQFQNLCFSLFGKELNLKTVP